MITKEILKCAKGLLTRGKFGIEKENLRVDQDGRLALTDHPAIFGDKSENPYITTDFSESQIEMITPPMDSIDEAIDFIHTLHSVISCELTGEMLWPQSLPATLPAEELIPIAKYSHSDREMELYREMLAKRYGKERQMMCGIHFNISLEDEFFELLASQTLGKYSARELRELLYLKMTRGIMRYRWILIWLFGKTPISEPRFRVRAVDSNKCMAVECTSSIALRNGPLGYRNKRDFTLDYNSMSAYHASVTELIDRGELNSEKELYQPIRLKFLAKDEGSPSYLEVRLLDVDPLSESGIDRISLYATHLVMLYSLLEDEPDHFGGAEQIAATRRQDYVSCYGRDSESSFPEDLAEKETIAQEVAAFIDRASELLEEFGVTTTSAYSDALKEMRSLAKEPSLRKGVAIYEGYKEKGFINYHLELAKRYHTDLLERGYRFYGREDMEMSTQLVMRAALCRGVEVEILDRKANFIRLTRGEKSELVVQATKCAIDNYATVLAMENKVVTKRLLNEQGIRVPAGGEYCTKEAALEDFSKYRDSAIVIKPKSTNFGLGITILKENSSLSIYERALDIAFKHDDTLLVEEFISGKEYRIFVVDNKVVDILHRKPANIIGDGTHTIGELIDIKNQDPKRGKGYKTPLEKIAKGEEERLFLELQSLDFDSVVELGREIFLRENSNISTGGDSIDYSDEVDISYKEIAIEAARAVGAKITGADMMIDDILQVATSRNHAIIEMNFNPAIHIHCFPYIGENRKLHFKILEALGF